MPLSIDTLKIEDKNLTGLNVGYDKEIYFSGRALDDRGKEICDKLSGFKVGSTVEVILESNQYGRRQGFYELYERVIPPREVTDRAIYRFSGKLRPVH